MGPDAATAAYLEEARGWDLERARAAQAAARRAWWVAGVACLLATVAVVAVAGLTPFKTVEPFVVRVDNSTGIVDVVPRYAGEVEWPEAVTRHLLTQYVAVRERYVAALAEADYEQVGAYQTAAMNQAWAGLWNTNNAGSPLNLHRDGSTVRVQVRAISFISRANGVRDLAQVRFLRATSLGQGAERVGHYIATVQYAYGPPSEDERLRGLNPLGFKVLEYRVEPELVETQPIGTGTGP
jgi:type IV secretion system protein VirB8